MLKGVRHARRSRAVALIGVLVLVMVILPVLPIGSSTVAAVPTGLPSHFGFGLSAGSGDTWMPQSGISWDYRYQYLVGGVNTGGGWETWNDKGQFVSYYATESAQHGYIPVFPYYELLESNGSCGSCGENQKDIANLNTPSLMNAYYANWELLMKRLGSGTYDGVQGYGKTVLIDVEPDFSGGYAMQAVLNSGSCFGYCTGQGNNPSLLKASVANSGFAEVAPYPNTYVGFTQALAHLRDVYAPNVLIGYDISDWATGDDIGVDTSSSTNGAVLGQQVGTFLRQLGPHEVLWNNPSDRDAGQYQALYGQNRWWDRQNAAYPNFRRWEQYLQGALSADGDKPMLLWQVPLGNQYFDTENNSNGHYQDNRPEYIFGHVQELISYGIVGALFGAGNGGNTTYTDANGDGVTNPGSFCTSAGTSGSQICNNHVSSVSDDDGGYVRMQAQAYYKAPVALSGSGGSGSTNTPTPTLTPTVTATASVTATPTRGSGSTSTPTPTPTSGSVSAPSFTLQSGASPNSVTRGSSTTVGVSVTSFYYGPGLVDLEVYTASGQKVFQQYWDSQWFNMGQSQTFTTTWNVPSTASTGTDTVYVGIFGPGWSSLYTWQAGGSVTVH